MLQEILEKNSTANIHSLAAKSARNPCVNSPVCIAKTCAVYRLTPWSACAYMFDVSVCIYSVDNCCVVSTFNKIAVVSPNVLFPHNGEKSAFSQHRNLNPDPFLWQFRYTQCTSITRCLSTLPGNIKYLIAKVILGHFVPIHTRILLNIQSMVIYIESKGSDTPGGTVIKRISSTQRSCVGVFTNLFCTVMTQELFLGG